MLTIPKILGAFLVASWFNSLLYMIEVGQVVYYFTTRGQDRLAIRSAVRMAILVDTVSTFAQCSFVYLSLIANYGMPPMDKAWPIPVMTVTNALSGTIMQSYLLYRFWTLSRQLPITLGIAIAIFMDLGAFIATTIYSIINPVFASHVTEDTTVTIALVSSAITDISLATALIWKLRTMSLPSPYKSTRETIWRISLTAFQTGIVPCTMAVIILILRFIINGSDEVGHAMYTCLGRVYSVTLLYNLNGRRVKGSNTMKDLSNSYNLTSIRVQATPNSGKTLALAESNNPQSMDSAVFKRRRRADSI